MTDEELAEMERRVEAWSGRFEEDSDGDLAICPGGQDAYVCPVSEVDGGVVEVAAMLNGIPALLAEVRRLRGEVEQARAAAREVEAPDRESIANVIRWLDANLTIARDNEARLRGEVAVPVDPTSGVLVPRTTEEWATVIDRAGLTNIVSPPGSPATARDERARVVAWLRGQVQDQPHPDMRSKLRNLADAIEAGEHDKEAT